MSVTLSAYFEDVQETLSDTLNSRKSIGFSSFSSPIVNQATVITYGIKPLDTEDSDRANFVLSIEYDLYYLTTHSESLDSKRQVLNLLVLNPEGDTKWTLNMRNRVWDGRYPSSVAIDTATGAVYLLFVESSYIELRAFGEVSLSDLEIFKSSMNARSPFSIQVDADALFKVVDGSEGTKFLLANLFISLFCSKTVNIPLL